MTARRAFLTLYLVGLLALTLLPLPDTAYQLASSQGLDKAVHAALFGGLAALLCWSQVPSARGLWRVVGPSAGLAAMVELLQLPLAYRTADPWDFFWGVVGALTAYLAACGLLAQKQHSAGRRRPSS